MPSMMQILLVAPALLTVAYGQGVIVSAQGASGSPASLAMQVKLSDTSDANIIRQSEVAGNIVNECGRTLLAGNIDIGTETETQLANNTVTSVTKGSKVAVTIRQGSTDGAGPYTCDMDFSSNADGISGQTNLTVTEKAANNGNIALTVTMPADMACFGASTGNVCTVRCFNSAAAGPFGGCFAVQQTDVTPNANTPETITTAQTLEGVLAQVAENQIDLPAAVKANQEATLDEQGIFGANALLALVSTSAGAPAATATATTSSAKAKSTGKKATSANNGNGNGNGNKKNARVFVS